MGEATTAFLAGAPPRAAPPSREAIALAALLFVERAGAPAPTATPTATWRASPLRLAVDGIEASVSVRKRNDERIVTLEEETLAMRLLFRAGNDIRFSSGGVDKRAASARDGDELWLDFDGACRRFVDRTYAPPQLKDEDSNGAVRSPVSGVIVGVEAKVGDKVRRGQALATVEAMKMQYSILAPIDGVVRMANASAGAHAQARAVLFAINPHGDH